MGERMFARRPGGAAMGTSDSDIAVTVGSILLEPLVGCLRRKMRMSKPVSVSRSKGLLIGVTGS